MKPLYTKALRKRSRTRGATWQDVPPNPNPWGPRPKPSMTGYKWSLAAYGKKK